MGYSVPACSSRRDLASWGIGPIAPKDTDVTRYGTHGTLHKVASAALSQTLRNRGFAFGCDVGRAAVRVVHAHDAGDREAAGQRCPSVVAGPADRALPRRK